MRDNLGRFIKGHISWNKDKKLLQFSGKNNPFFGKQHTKKSKELIMKARTKIINTNLNESLLYVIGVAYGDGSLHIWKEKNGNKHYKLTLAVKDKDFRDFFVSQVKNIEAHATVWKSKRGFYLASITSKMLYNFIKNFDLNKLLNVPKDVKCAFLKGFFDSEGSIQKYKLVAVNKNKFLIELCQKLLSSINIDSSVYKIKGSGFNPNGIYWALYIFRIESIKKFYESIGFSIKRKQEKLEKVKNPIYKKWTKEEIKLLKTNKSCKELRKLLNRSGSSIWSQRWSFEKHLNTKKTSE